MIVVIGGGPAGSTCAARLAQLGRHALLLEKVKHPRFHLGESLLPASMPVLKELGVYETVQARFMPKYGAVFHEDATGKTARYAFDAAWGNGSAFAFQVPRDEFDELLLRHAASLGVEVREGWTVTRVTDTRVEAKGPDGAVHTIDASFVVDASGRDALKAHDLRSIGRIAHLDRTAIYTHVRGAWRDDAERAGDIQIVCFGEGEDAGWWWFIPFKDGRTSVGAVVSGAWIKKHKAKTEDLFREAVSESAVARRLLQGAEPLFGPDATADFSFRVADRVGDGWLAAGDAGGFIDPLFSTGAHLAMWGGARAAEAIDRALAAGDVSRARFAEWDAITRYGAELFTGAVQAFYTGALTPLIFADKTHPYLQRAITTMLSGAVFDPEARWARDMRTRFPAS